MFNPHQTFSEYFHQGNPFIMEGQVVDTNDPDQMGRVRAWVPALDGELYDVNALPWADYASPFGGFTVDYPAGENMIENKSHASYGFWAIPKIGATVLVFCLNGNPEFRCYFASTVRLHRNRSLPAGRNTDFFDKPGPFGDAGDGKGNLNQIEPAYTNLRTQFQNKIGESEAKTRGAYERSVAQQKLDKDGKEGYQHNAKDPSYLDCQTYCLVTPGRHAMIMQDHPETSRLRLKTGEGHQIIFDDANERIYVSTARGNSWIELDQDGHIHIYGNESISVHSANNINLYADKDIRMRAGNSIHMTAESKDIRMTAGNDIFTKAAGAIKQAACKVFDLSTEASFKLTAEANIDVHAKSSLKTTGDADVHHKAGGKMQIQSEQLGLNGGSAMKLSAGKIDLNNGSAGNATKAEDATCPEPAEDVEIIPQFEPWKRPASKVKRGPNWKP
jgi:phage gp45-like